VPFGGVVEAWEATKSGEEIKTLIEVNLWSRELSVNMSEESNH
jgi:hypothetical protein